jgi:hypothetical protein
MAKGQRSEGLGRLHLPGPSTGLRRVAQGSGCGASSFNWRDILRCLLITPTVIQNEVE